MASKVFSNFKDLCGALDKDADIQEKVAEYAEEQKSKKARNVRMDTMEWIAQELMMEIMNNLNDYYESYEPSKYVRTYDMRNMFDMNSSVQIDKKKKIVTIYFNEAAWHRNIFNTHSSFVPLLLDQGWSVGGSTKKRSRFEYYEGSQFISRAIKKMNSKYKSYGVHIEFEGPTNFY